MRTILTGMLILTAWAAPAPAIVLHPCQPSLPAALHPDDAVIGRWGLNASCVAIGPDLVVTTIHQDESNPLAPRTVVIDGVSYTATIEEDFVGGDVDPPAEIRLARLTRSGQPADLAYWTDLYTPADGPMDNRLVAIGGYGKGRGQHLTTATGQVYGYQWSGGGNTTLRWGQNRIWETSPDKAACLFDGPGRDTGILTEAAVAEFDSGGGWFVRTGQRWHLLGITLSTEHATSGQSWFASPTDASPDEPYPDWITALRIDVHEPWIEQLLGDVTPVPGDVDRDGDVDFDDLVALAAHYGTASGAGWSMGNFDGDGDVDVNDLTLMARAYGTGLPVGLDFQADLQAVGVLPEPSSLVLLLAGAMVWRRRRAAVRAVRR